MVRPNMNMEKSNCVPLPIARFVTIIDNTIFMVEQWSVYNGKKLGSIWKEQIKNPVVEQLIVRVQLSQRLIK